MTEPAVALNPAAPIALSWLVNRVISSPHVSKSVRVGARWCGELIARELNRLAVERNEARAQVVADRAELDAYRNRYGPLRPSNPLKAA